jgi:uncharacterized membrane protein
MNSINIHPLLVHFPIAFFVTYAVFELIPFKSIKKQSFWFYIKAILVILGVLGAGAAVITGKLVENQFPDKRSLISIHSTINELASAVFAIIAFAYLISWIQKSPKANVFVAKLGKLWKLALKTEKIVLETPVIYVLALAGLILISIGGALGGAIAYGPDFDPFTHFIYSLFFH